MSWLISLFMAGVVFSTDTAVPTFRTDYKAEETARVISLDDTERFEQSYPLNSNGKISVSNINGSITIVAWDRNEVKLLAVKTADSKENLDEVEVKIDARSDHFSVKTDFGNSKRDGRTWKNFGRIQVDYTLTVPKGAVLDEIETVNGSVSITDASNVTKASAVNGQIRAVNLRGAAELSTVNGTIEASFDQLQASGKIDLNTVNGQVNLTIPSDSNVTLKADTVNGKIANDFGLPVRKGEYVGRDMYGRIGSGETRVTLSSVNGELNVKRKSDGKNVNPAVNLLPQKDQAEFPESDSSSPVNTARMNKEISRAVAQGQRDAEIAMKNAEKDLKRARVEMDRARVEAPELPEMPQMPVIDTELVRNQVEQSLRMSQQTLARLADVSFLAAPVVDQKSETFSVKGTPKVTINGANCTVHVRGWDRMEVKYTITKISRARSSEPLRPSVERNESDVKITVNGGKAIKDEFFPESESIRVEVFVPKKSNLRIVTDREIRLENVTGEIDLTGGNASINVRDSEGLLRVGAIDGKIRVIGFKGEIEAKSADGDISLEGEFSRLTAATVDGTIILTLPERVNGTFQANTPEVDFSGVAPTRVPTADKSSDLTVWRLGEGAATFDFRVGDGRVVVRSADQIKASL